MLTPSAAPPLPEGSPATQQLLVVDDPDDPPEHPSGWELVGTTDYLYGPTGRWSADAVVWNRSPRTGFLHPGFGVSHLAEARGHRAFPSARSLALADAPAPPPRLREPGAPPTLGVLYDVGSPVRPCRPDSVEHIARIAAKRGARTRVFDAGSLDALSGCDALLVRAETGVGNAAWRFAVAAERMGIPVIDDPGAILVASNKAWQAERFSRRGIPLPRWRLVHAGNAREVGEELGFPCVLKQAYGCCGREVQRIADPAELEASVRALAALDTLLIAQRFVPGDFDWRVAVLEGSLLFAARYHYVPGYWKGARWHGEEAEIGVTEAVPKERVPPAIAACALAAAREVGAGLYGMDIKETPEGAALLELNDNIDIDVDCEDAAEGEPLYHRLLDALLPERDG